MTKQKQQLIDSLKNMFQLDQPELDFGLYKIMHARSQQITDFLEQELGEQIDQVFGEARATDSRSQLEPAKARVLETLGDSAFDADGNLLTAFQGTPAGKDYLNVLAASQAGGSELGDTASIYDHLYRFFSRYYDNGDFMSRRYHVAENSKRAAPYAVPYDGREVYLHWANKDQYYIKTSESFSHYTFNLSEALRKQRQAGAGELDFGTDDSERRVHFQLAEADEGVHNNTKENQSRFFIIHAGQPVKLNDAGELCLQFEYRYDPEKSGQDRKWQEKRQAEAEKLILNTLKAQPAFKDWYAGLATPMPTEKQKQRTLLGKYLTQYTARNSMDYFIHKDLGGFLSRELDFYIKNEIIRLDDVEQADAVSVESWLLKVKVLRKVAKQIIAFLAQLEDFQKKLWLKKKFVTEAQYCMTLDRVSEDLYPLIADNQQQHAEWVQLGFIDADKVVTEEFLRANPYLLVDTALYPDSFKAELLASIQNLDEQCDGTLMHSDNFQALNLMQERYREQVKCIYIDPPYNTDASAIIYKNDYKNSSWMSLINDRVSLSSSLMVLSGILCLAIDDEEFINVKQQLNDIFEKEIGVAVVRSNPQSRKAKETFSPSHEYVLFFGKSRSALPGSLELTDKRLARYPYKDEKGNFAWLNLIRTGNNDKRVDRPKLFYPIYVDLEDNIRVPKMIWSEIDGDYIIHEKESKSIGEVVVWPIVKVGSDWVEKRWHRGFQRIESEPAEYRVRRSADGKVSIDFKTRIDETSTPVTWWDKKEYASANYGAADLKGLFGEKTFDFSKARKLVEDCLRASGSTTEDREYILDYFAGSGTTAHAVINLNREDNGHRKYILVEQGDYFNTVLKPRIKKVAYSENWKDGKPTTKDNNSENPHNGISHCFRYLRLESYEDTLNNLQATIQPDYQQMPRDYFLYYLLETETAGSPSLLNISQFSDPTQYHLNIKQPGTDAQREQTIDLLETFNWLIGLRVELIDKWRSYDAELSREPDPDLPEDQHTRLMVKGRLQQRDAYGNNPGQYHFRTVEGYACRMPGDTSVMDKVLIVWRKLSDDLEKDSAVLEAVLDKMGINQADSEYDLIYINGSHGLQLHGSSKSRLMSLEETFMAKMWEGA